MNKRLILSAIRKRIGMLWFFPHWRREFDTSDPKYSGLYGPIHNEDAEPDIKWEEQDLPNEEFLELWKAKIKEVIDK